MLLEEEKSQLLKFGLKRVVVIFLLMVKNMMNILKDLIM